MNFYFLFLSNHQTWWGGDKWKESDAVLSLSLCKGIFITFSIIHKLGGQCTPGSRSLGLQVTSVKPSAHPSSLQLPKSLLCFNLHLAPKHTHFSVSYSACAMQCFEVHWVHARVWVCVWTSWKSPFATVGWLDGHLLLQLELLQLKNHQSLTHPLTPIATTIQPISYTPEHTHMLLRALFWGGRE